MSGWDQWAATLCAGSKNELGAIIARDGSSVWGKCGDFSVIWLPYLCDTLQRSLPIPLRSTMASAMGEQNKYP